MMILLTGSAGYLGSRLYIKLKELGLAVVGVDVKQHSTVDLVCDISDSKAVEGTT
jgi:nucleoside-diphosphate-sugar epimerase